MQHTKISQEGVESVIREVRLTVQKFLRDAKILQGEMHLLHKIIPEMHKKARRQIIEGIALIGGLGTNFGAYNTAQIAQLNNKFGHLAQNLVKLATSMLKTDEEIEPIHDSIWTPCFVKFLSMQMKKDEE